MTASYFKLCVKRGKKCLMNDDEINFALWCSSLTGCLMVDDGWDDEGKII